MVSAEQDTDQVLGQSKRGWRRPFKVATKRDFVIRGNEVSDIRKRGKQSCKELRAKLLCREKVDLGKNTPPGETERYCSKGIVGEKEEDKAGDIRGPRSGRALGAHEEPGFRPV